jgi:hypothetical protein
VKCSADPFMRPVPEQRAVPPLRPAPERPRGARRADRRARRSLGSAAAGLPGLQRLCRHDLAVSGKRGYVSGFFSRFDGLPRNGVIALDPRTGAVDRGSRPARSGQQILALALAGRRLYLGTTNGLRALDPETGAALGAPRVRFRDVFVRVARGRGSWSTAVRRTPGA